MLLACAQSYGNGLEPVASCDTKQQVAVVVSSVQTVFTWLPACGMASLEVTETGSGSTSWALFTGSKAAQNPLRSGVEYGKVPSEAISPQPRPDPLRRGELHSHRIAVGRRFDHCVDQMGSTAPGNVWGPVTWSIDANGVVSLTVGRGKLVNIPGGHPQDSGTFIVRIQRYGGKGVGHWTLDVPDGSGGWDHCLR